MDTSLVSESHEWTTLVNPSPITEEPIATHPVGNYGIIGGTRNVSKVAHNGSKDRVKVEEQLEGGRNLEGIFEVTESELQDILDAPTRLEGLPYKLVEVKEKDFKVMNRDEIKQIGNNWDEKYTVFLVSEHGLPIATLGKRSGDDEDKKLLEMEEKNGAVVAKLIPVLDEFKKNLDIGNNSYALFLNGSKSYSFIQGDKINMSVLSEELDTKVYIDMKNLFESIQKILLGKIEYRPDLIKSLEALRNHIPGGCDLEPKDLEGLNYCVLNDNYLPSAGNIKDSKAYLFAPILNAHKRVDQEVGIGVKTIVIGGDKKHYAIGITDLGIVVVENGASYLPWMKENIDKVLEWDYGKNLPELKFSMK